MEEKFKVILLGLDQEKLEKLCIKINESKPIEVMLHTELQTFLQICIEQRPDMIGISLSYPHSSITRFPKVFKMALGVPIIIFGEDDKVATRKLLSETNSDFRINGKINPTNLWTKIVNYQKEQELEKEKLENEHNKSDQDNSNNTVILKGSKNNKEDLRSSDDKKNLLKSIISQFDEDQDHKAKQKLSLVTSGKATEYKQAEINHINTVDMKGLDDDGSDESSQTKRSTIVQDGPGMGRASDQSKLSKTNGSIDLSSENIDESAHRESKPQSSSSIESSSSNKKKNPNQTTENSNESGGELEPEKNPGFQSTKDKDSNDFNTSKKQKGSEQEAEPIKPPKAASPSSMPDQSAEKKDASSAQKPKAVAKKTETKSAEDNEKKPFGEIKLTQDKTTKVKESIEKKKKKEEDQERQRNYFKESCELALESTFFAKKLEKPRDFDTESVMVFVVEMGSLKGFLMMTNSFNHSVEPLTSDDFITNIIESMKAKGESIEIAEPVVISIKLENYREMISAFSEFFIDYEEETGKQHVLSFVQREYVRPKFGESDKDGMFLVDIKSIPPKTVVNFDAFLYLPKNKKFVRYLKEGRSLSLEQAKRHAEMSKDTKFYLPSDNKQKFIQFYIQNTIDWEIAIQKNKKAS